jgi:hypothetical protein
MASAIGEVAKPGKVIDSLVAIGDDLDRILDTGLSNRALQDEQVIFIILDDQNRKSLAFHQVDRNSLRKSRKPLRTLFHLSAPT